MPNFICPNCSKTYAVNTDKVGRKVKCRCGAINRVPRTDAIPSPLPPQVRILNCPQCQHNVEPIWNACPACGQRLTTVRSSHSHVNDYVLPPTTTERRPSDNTGAKVAVSQQSDIGVAANRAVPPTSSWLPLSFIGTGSESVVQADIDASHNVSAAGDYVHHKEVHETHIHKESVVRAIADLVDRGGAAPTTPQQCIEKITHTIHAGIGVIPIALLFLFWPVGLYLVLSENKRKDATVQALLSRLRGFLREQPTLQHEYDRLAAEWDSRRSHNRKMTYMICIAMGCVCLLPVLLSVLNSVIYLILGLAAIAAICFGFMTWSRQKNESLRQNVQSLIGGSNHGGKGVHA